MKAIKIKPDNILITVGEIDRNPSVLRVTLSDKFFELGTSKNMKVRAILRVPFPEIYWHLHRRLYETSETR